MRAVVIGSGFGGLAAAIRLRALGHDVVVIEARDRPGGRAAAFESGGFRFDAGPTIITAPWMIDDLFHVLGHERSNHLDLVRLDPFYRVHFDDGSYLVVNGDEAAMEVEIARLSPRDLPGFHRFRAACRRIFDEAMPLIDVPASSLRSMARFLPVLVRTRAWASVASLARSEFADERLQRAFSFHPLLIGGNPFTSPSLYALIPELERRWGVWYAIGGTYAFVRSLVDLLKEHDVPVELNTRATRIEIGKNGRAVAVHTQNGARVPADLVVSNADPAAFSERTETTARSHARELLSTSRVGRHKYGMSVFILHLGLNRRFPELGHHEIVLGRTYRELLTDIFDRRQLSSDFSLYLHHPTKTDDSVAPTGCDLLYALAPVPNLAGGTDWDRSGDELRDRILDLLERRFMPGLRSSIEQEFRIDPRHFRDELRTPYGSAFSIEPTLSQSAWFRPRNQSKAVPNLFLVGAGTHPGAGIPGVLSSAKIVADLIGPAASPQGLRRVTSRPTVTSSRR